MADFCAQCASEIGMETDFTFEDKRKGYYYSVLCEGCGNTMVNSKGECVSPLCLCKGHNVEVDKDLVFLASSTNIDISSLEVEMEENVSLPDPPPYLVFDNINEINKQTGYKIYIPTVYGTYNLYTLA